MAKDPAKTKPTAAFKVGAISLVFLVIGYQVALFVHKTAVLSIVAHRDSPDTVFVYVAAQVSDSAANPTPSVDNSLQPAYPTSGRRSSAHSAAAVQAYREFVPRRYESFRFNPNTISHEDLQRLGFSEK